MKDQTPSRADEGRIQEYLTGRLDETDAARFEERMFADDELAAEVERALEIRAALSPGSVQRRTSGPSRRVWFALAAAASVAVLAVGIVSLQPPAPTVFRGVEQRMGLEVEVEGGALRARWQPIAGAAGYELQLFAQDGRSLRSLETDDAAAILDLGAPAELGAAPAFIEVSALDQLGQTLRRSDRLALPDR